MTLLFYYLAPLQNDTDVTLLSLLFTSRIIYIIKDVLSWLDILDRKYKLTSLDYILD